MSIFKTIIGLMINKAPRKQYYLQVGALLLKKGCNVQLGQIIESKKLDSERSQVKVITGLYYDFRQNKINHTIAKKTIKG